MMWLPVHVIFYGFAFVAVASAAYVVTARNPVNSVLALVVTFFAMAGVWMLLRAEFLSLILVLVYVGAVMTLFLFVVMMLNIDTESRHSGFVRYLPLGVILVLLLTGIMIAMVGPESVGMARMPALASEAPDYSNTARLGMLIYTNYVYAFEIAGVLLLAAIIAAITLTHRPSTRRRSQNISHQIAADPKTSVRLVNMASEPRQGR